MVTSLHWKYLTKFRRMLISYVKLDHTINYGIITQYNYVSINHYQLSRVCQQWINSHNADSIWVWYPLSIMNMHLIIIIVTSVLSGYTRRLMLMHVKTDSKSKQGLVTRLGYAMYSLAQQLSCVIPIIIISELNKLWILLDSLTCMRLCKLVHDDAVTYT